MYCQIIMYVCMLKHIYKQFYKHFQYIFEF